ncbi:trichoplein keratin filament-binding protein-like isoform X2 [Hydra vulgaris]|uniref:Trichoplein keratin filament-binding protein n=1 Tax=Hydra vulgaris TaxID=6087 RepID=A0ABM4CP18_HYDVU
MALPTLCPRWVKSMKSPAEISVQHYTKREQINASNISNYQFFKNSEVQANKIKEWSSKDSFEKSMVCVDKLIESAAASEKKHLLELRRNKLHILLLKENEFYQDELKKLRFTSIKYDRVEHLQAKKEERRKLIAAEKDYECWRKNDPRIREIKKCTEEFDARLEEQMAKENLHALNNIKNYQNELKKKEKQISHDLLAQINELEKKNKEAESLRNEEMKLQEHNLFLLNMEKKRELIKKQKEKQDFGDFLIRQNKQQLKNRSKQIQEALEMDLQLLEEVAKKEAEERTIYAKKKDKLKADAQSMQQVFADQLRLEKIREAELENFYQENANIQWRKRESEWDREAQARERLIKTVLEERQKQIEEKIAQVHIEQKSSIAEREKLLMQIEEHKSLLENEQAIECIRKNERKQEILDQISSRESEVKKAQISEEKDQDLLMSRELSKEVLVKSEAERMNSKSFEHTFRRRKVAFT